MDSNRKTGRVIGILFLLNIIVGSLSLNLRGLSTSVMESESFLKNIFENSTKMKFYLLLDLITVGTWVQIFDYKLSFYLYMQNGLAMTSLTIWLLVKGFNSLTEATQHIQERAN